MKYIILSIDGHDCPIIFPDVLKHKEVDTALKELFGNYETLSAGFTEIDIKYAIGESYTLNLKSRPEDAAIMQRVARL